MDLKCPRSGRLDSNQRPHAPKASQPTAHNLAQANNNQQKLKHDRDLSASPCSRFVTPYHLISHRHVNLRSTNTTPGKIWSLVLWVSNTSASDVWNTNPLTPPCPCQRSCVKPYRCLAQEEVRPANRAHELASTAQLATPAARRPAARWPRSERGDGLRRGRPCSSEGQT